eukprot:CAMPEP_0170546500 /NCGR_PEP_ID=MMETSP0211-20121228/4855_1 /TAXON_ID=311385 /ORGANISM="Pseudokeronopsis sp., Strain OXSARD2" /LENGTH=95 /DNA_ID=CAMNT_0010850995 /DNA_START=820 /DNA_END=1107 /DNA_ORIENTATION=-
MRQSAHGFRGHIPRCPTRLDNSIDSSLHSRGQILFHWELSGNPKICEHEVAILVEHQVFWFDVSVDDSLAVHVLQRKDQASNHEPGLFLIIELVG